VTKLATRNAAAGQDQIVAVRHFLQAIGQRSAIVAQDAEIADRAAKALEHRCQHEAVGVE
jgi:hypothetical protein